MRVGILTSGGDCQALNATMRGLVKALYQQRKDIEIIGFLKGYQGLMYEKYKKMSLSDFEDILNDESIDVVAEVMGGVEPAFTFSKRANASFFSSIVSCRK